MRLPWLAVVVFGFGFIGCKDGSKAGADGGGGSAAGATGGAGSAAGAGGATAGTGGRGGTGGQVVLTSCPAFQPTPGQACSGNFTCSYDAMCICGVCCVYGFQCQNGGIAMTGFVDACTQVNPLSCRDGGVDGNRDGNVDTRGAVCTPGANQSCNDNPAISSIHGTCTDAGTCVCNNDAAPLAGSGRCP